MKSSPIAMFSLMLTCCWAHLCLISPPQRGSMVGLNELGASDCRLLTKPCGGRDTRGPEVTLKPGERFVITFQKNLDFFNQQSPGYFLIQLGPSVDEFIDLYQAADTADPALTLFSANVTMPPEWQGRMILRAVYVTNNLRGPSHFYQCADVQLRN